MQEQGGIGQSLVSSLWGGLLFVEFLPQQMKVSFVSSKFFGGVGRGSEVGAVSWIRALALEGNPFCCLWSIWEERNSRILAKLIIHKGPS